MTRGGISPYWRSKRMSCAAAGLPSVVRQPIFGSSSFCRPHHFQSTRCTPLLASIDQNGGPVLSWVTAVSLTGFHRTCGSSSNTGSKLPAVDKDSRGHGVRLARLLPEVAFPSMINSSSRSRWIPTKLLARARKIDRDLQDWLQIVLPFEPV